MRYITLALSSFALGFALCKLVWTVASAKAPEPMPEPAAVVEQDEGRLPGDDIPATEYAVWTGPELVSLGEFTLTHYCPCELCCGEWADGITYTGTTATEGRTIAVDPDVIPLGSTVVIDGHEYIAEDIGGAIRGNRIDIFMRDHLVALMAGVKTAEVFIYE
jgi:3D (Asp-Asp-Asp) domain-containing protein